MYYGKIMTSDTANGPGMRVTLFVSGCRNACKGCFNKDTWNFQYGQEFTEEIRNGIFEKLTKPYYQGLTILGGEPLEPENQPDILKLLQKFRERFADTRDVWMFSGFTYEETQDANRRCHTEITNDILSKINVLVDGRFRLEEKDVTLRFRGSRNQRLIDIPKTLNDDRVIMYSD